MKAFDDLTNKELLQGLKDPAKAQGIITNIQDSLDVIVTSFNEMKEQVAKSHTDLDQACELVRQNEKACIDLTQTIKNIHIALNSHRDQIPAALVDLADELGKFVMSGAAIKAGVKANENDTK